MTELVLKTSPGIEAEISGNIKAGKSHAIGEDVTVNLSVENLTTDAKVISADIKACSILYTRKEINELLKETRTIQLQGCEVKDEPVTITYAQYDGLLTADNAIEVTAVFSYEQVEGTLIMQTNIVLDNPKFEIKVKGPAYLNKPVTAEVVFTNPLNQEVSDIVVTAEGSGLLRDPTTVKGGSVKPKETTTIPLTFTPYKSGPRHLLVDLTSSKFLNSKGYVELDVQQPMEEKPKEKSEEKPKGKSEEKPMKKSEEKPTEKSEEKPMKKSEEKPKEKSEEKPMEKPEEKPKEKSEEKPKGKSEEKPMKKSEEKPKEKSEEKPMEKSEEKPKEKSEEKPKEKSEEKSKEKSSYCVTL